MKIKFKLLNDLGQLKDGQRFIPLLPDVKGLVPQFADNPHGTLLIEKGPHSASTFLYGVCDSDASLPAGVEVVSEQVFHEALRSVRYNVPHQDGWVFDENNMVWVPSVPYPEDGSVYEWDEEKQTWIKVG